MHFMIRNVKIVYNIDAIRPVFTTKINIFWKYYLKVTQNIKKKVNAAFLYYKKIKIKT